MVVVGGNLPFADFQQLRHRERREIKFVAESGGKPLVQAQQLFHRFLVAAEDHRNVSLSLIGQQWHQQWQHILARVVRMGGIEQVRLINHQHPASCRLDCQLEIPLFRTPVGAEEGAAGAYHHMPA